MTNKLLVLVTAFMLVACEQPAPAPDNELDELANEYLFLELSMGLHDKAHVDAYFGPEAFREAAEAEAMSSVIHISIKLFGSEEAWLAP